MCWGVVGKLETEGLRWGKKAWTEIEEGEGHRWLAAVLVLYINSDECSRDLFHSALLPKQTNKQAS